ncbi:ClbS/DfsB family four-helix bundle protein [Acidobacteriota bacterium]
MRFTSKKELLESIVKEHRAFVELASSVPKARYRENGVWGDGWTIKDLFAHLTEWEQMFLAWYRAGRAGETPVLPVQGYKWNQIRELNRAIWQKYRRKSLKMVLDDFDASYKEILSIVRALSEKSLLTPGHFEWTGKYPLTTYLAPNTCSHYRTASKFLKRWLKGKKRLGGQ